MFRLLAVNTISVVSVCRYDTCAFAFVLQIVTLALTFTVFSGLHAQTQCLLCPPFFFCGRTDGAESFFAGSCNWCNYKPHPKKILPRHIWSSVNVGHTSYTSET